MPKMFRGLDDFVLEFVREARTGTCVHKIAEAMCQQVEKYKGEELGGRVEKIASATLVKLKIGGLVMMTSMKYVCLLSGRLHWFYVPCLDGDRKEMVAAAPVAGAVGLPSFDAARIVILITRDGVRLEYEKDKGAAIEVKKEVGLDAQKD